MNPRHGWNSWDHYQDVHRRHIENYRGWNFIIQDALTPTLTTDLVAWRGVLFCVDGLEIHVRKFQDVEHQAGRPMVRTRVYNYHALRRTGEEVINLFRYDNVHVHPDHPDAHHRHRFDARGVEIEPTQHIGVDRWPTLGDVIDELYHWWLDQPPSSG